MYTVRTFTSLASIASHTGASEGVDEVRTTAFVQARLVGALVNVD